MRFDPVTTRASGKEHHSDVLAYCAPLCWGEARSAMKEQFRSNVPLGRLRDSDEIANVVSSLPMKRAMCLA